MPIRCLSFFIFVSIGCFLFNFLMYVDDQEHMVISLGIILRGFIRGLFFLRRLFTQSVTLPLRTPVESRLPTSRRAGLSG